MPLYFFHICDGLGVIPDDEGMNFADDEAAKREGEASARDILSRDIRDKQLQDDRRIEVTDREGAPVATFMLRDLIL